ncbi:uncharacterized protein KY384_001227 [Bacidia gigantensis]|uniref:uncharacterized protein n=1 Tax=Bacidia gigantensis TaxID=2732470 RepID=UPI001D051955|nr:uncharacterized protein KY384_001227 [Bacidia gigantensis]KAG8534382.1 hypothetical protein KY384_001227 [Bacidia gigantensis]
MDPFSALGLAGNIIQFIDFGSKIVSSSFDIYKSVDGSSSVSRELISLTESLEESCDSLLEHQNSMTRHRSIKAEKDLLDLSRSCKELAEEFLGRLQSLKVNGGNRKWQSLRQAVKSAWKEKESQVFAERLEKYRSQILLLLVQILSGQTSKTQRAQSKLLSQQSQAAGALDQLVESHRQLNITTANEASRMRRDILKDLKQLITEDNRRNLCPLASKLSSLMSEGDVKLKELKIIESLQFSAIHEREERIVGAHPATFDWLLEEESSESQESARVSMLEWLKTRNGIYWITGKPGSGKSTLMKYVYQHPKALAALRHWSGDKQLLTAHFFFWNAGTDIQKSQQGLLQTLLYHVLRQSPELVSTVCMKQWSALEEGRPAIPWTRIELLAAFEGLRMQTIESAKFCFFIDGLDEFGGQHTDIIKNFASSEDVKVCISSRPWNVFERAYGTNFGMRINLHDLTREDITRFVAETLTEDALFRELKESDSRYEDLVLDIVDRAEGVFLWVFLVVRSLQRGLTNSDTIFELQKRLQMLPTDLEVFFKNMLDSVEKFYHEHAARIYLMCLAASGSLTTMSLSYFDEENPSFGCVRNIKPWSPHQVDRRCKASRTRILARCTDLLQISNDNRVDFLHRTVNDFLQTRDMTVLLIERAGADFNSHYHLCNAMLAQIKTIPTGATYDGQSSHAEDLTSLIDHLMYHAYQLEVETRSPGQDLLLEMEHTVATLRSANADGNWRALDLKNGFREGWIFSRAIQEGLYRFLSKELTGVKKLIENGGIGRLPLDIALRPKSSHHSRGSDPRIIRLLLDQGADPNQQWEGVITWGLYLSNAARELSAARRRNNFVIVEMLLMHGADLSLRDGFFEFVRSCTPVEADRLNDLKFRANIQDQQRTSDIEAT